VCRHRAAALDLLLVQRPSVFGRRLVAHLFQRPGEVHGRGARTRERRRGRIDVLPALSRERNRVRSGDTDCRRATNRKRPDRLDDFGDRAALELDLLVGQPALVEEDDLWAVLLEPDDPSRR
jgi:hypothetical protein